MGVELFFVQFNLLSGDPKFTGTGWFKDRWVRMDDNTKLNWVEHNINSLRRLWNQGDDVGLVRHGFGLSHTLAQLDILMLTSRLDTLIEAKEIR